MRAFNVLLFAGLTAWSAVTHWRAVPGFGCLALGQLSFLVLLIEAGRGRPRTMPLLSFLALTYLGLALLLAAVFGTPTSGRFWVVFAGVAVVLAPVVLLARSSLDVRR